MPLFGKSNAPATKLFFATDVHGSERTWRKFINAGKFYNANVLVMGGDIIGKLAIPIIRQKDGGYRATLQGTVEHFTSQDELEGSAGAHRHARLLQQGHGRRRIPGDAGRSRQAVDDLFHTLARERLLSLGPARPGASGRHGHPLLHHRRQRRLHATSWPSCRAAATDRSQACEGEVVQLDAHHTMASLGISTPTPWHTPREVTDDELAVVIEKLLTSVPDAAKCIFNFHDPPDDSTLDTCPMLDWTTDPPAPSSRPARSCCTGRAASRCARRSRPTSRCSACTATSTSSPGVVRIGRTLCVNPGSEYGEGVLRGCPG